MAKCKDCVHYDACKDAYDGNWDDFDECDLYCEHFKNKADFVEVVRCSECKHLKIINKEPIYAECEKEKLTFLLWQADIREHSCSYGERKKNDKE